MEGSELSALYETGTVWPMGTVSFLDQEGARLPAPTGNSCLEGRRQATVVSAVLSLPHSPAAAAMP